MSTLILPLCGSKVLTDVFSNVPPLPTTIVESPGLLGSSAGDGGVAGADGVIVRNIGWYVLARGIIRGRPLNVDRLVSCEACREIIEAAGGSGLNGTNCGIVAERWLSGVCTTGVLLRIVPSRNVTHWMHALRT